MGLLAASVLAALGTLAGLFAWSGEWDVRGWQETTAVGFMVLAGPGLLALLAALALAHDRELAVGAVVLSVVLVVVLLLGFVLLDEVAGHRVEAVRRRSRPAQDLAGRRSSDAARITVG